MKKPLRTVLFLLLPLLLALNSCTDNSKGLVEEADGMLFWSGEYMVDGCGFHLVMNDTSYKPDNEDDIGEAFKTQDPIPVTVKIERLQQQIDRRCGLATQSRAMEGIRVISISKRE